MSDENVIQPAFFDETCDAHAPTERDPSRPARGLALSVLSVLSVPECES